MIRKYQRQHIRSFSPSARDNATKPAASEVASALFLDAQVQELVQGYPEG
jgi:hypothetical protein